MLLNYKVLTGETRKYVFGNQMKCGRSAWTEVLCYARIAVRYNNSGWLSSSMQAAGISRSLPEWFYKLEELASALRAGHRHRPLCFVVDPRALA